MEFFVKIEEGNFLNQKTLKKILKSYEKKRDLAIKNADFKKEKIYKEIPKLKQINEEIVSLGLKMSKEAILNPDKSKEIALKVKDEITKLKLQEDELLATYHLDKSFLEPEFECFKCNDKGFLKDGKKCACLIQEMISQAYAMSNLGEVFLKENFTNFNINLFSKDRFTDYDISPRENMMNILLESENFIKDFQKKNGDNLIFFGGTGLGKTFMCNCIAKELLDKNFLVLYQTSFRIMEVIQKLRFNKSKEASLQDTYDYLFECDLLIIDDLGTELTSSFTTSELFNIINTRIIEKKKTIISTNLDPKEIADSYTERIFSRIFSHFKAFEFFGEDLRWQQ